MIRTLEAADVPAAAGLLVARHQEHRGQSPLLRPLDLPGAVAELEALLAVDGASGAVAVAGDEVVGYLVGTPRSADSWGPNVWVEAAGFAGDRIADLYAFAAADWVATGRVAHYVVSPPYLSVPWIELAFGIQHVHAAQAVAPQPPDPRIRSARRADIPALARLDMELDRHLTASPVFSGLSSPPYEEAVAEWEADFDDYTVLVTELDGTVVGSTVGCDVVKSSGNTGLIGPEHAALLGFATVLPEARGHGLGRALGTALHGWAHEEGFPVICTDWRSTNLTASRTWPSLGYETTFLRLHRLVGR